MERAVRRDEKDRAADAPGRDEAGELFLAFARQGDRSALEAAVLRVAPRLRAAASRLARANDVDDLLHDCLVVAIRRATDFAADRLLLPWLLGVLHNVARSRHRRRWARLRSASTSDDHELGVYAAEPAAPAVGADLDRAEWMRAFTSQLETLSEPYRSVVRDHLVRGEPLVAIAARLERPASTVRNQFVRGLRELKRRLPTPVLAGVVGLLAVRGANAGGPPLTLRPGRRWQWSAAVAAASLAAMALVGTFALAPAANSIAPGAPGPAPAAAAADGPAAAVIDAPGPGLDSRTQATPGLTVRMHYPDGSPVAGLPVLFQQGLVLGSSLWRTRASWRSGTTNADGIVRFDVTRTGLAAIRVSDTAMLHRFEIGTEPLELSLTIPARPSITVRVADDVERPVAGADILLSGTDGRGSPGWIGGKTDADGVAVVVSTLPAYTLRAIADGHAPSPLHIVEVETRAVRELQLHVARTAHRARGSVRLPGGQPAPHASVAVWQDALSQPPCFVAADEEGRFSFPLAANASWSVAACADGCAPAVAHRLDAAAEPILQLTVGGALRGQLDPKGAASRTRLFARAVSSAADDPFGQGGSYVDTGGRFRIAELAPGPYLFRVYEGNVDLGAAVEATVVGGDDTEVAYTLPDPPRWVVRVRDEYDRPLANCAVRVRDARYLARGSMDRASTTDADGIARFPFGDRVPMEVFVHLPRGSVHDSLEAGYRAAVAGEDVVVTVPGPEGVATRVHGHVSGAHRDGVVTAFMLCGRNGARMLENGADGTVWTDEVPAGAFTLRQVCEAGGRMWSWPLRPVLIESRAVVDLGLIERLPLTEVLVALPSTARTARVRAQMRTADGDEIAMLDVTADRPERLYLPAGRYVCAYADAAATAREHGVTVVDGAVRVVLDHAGGRPCRIEVRPTRVPEQFGWLRARLRASSQAPCELHLEPVPDQAVWFGQIDLTPGEYFVDVAFGDQSTSARLAVEAGAGQQVFSFTLP